MKKRALLNRGKCATAIILGALISSCAVSTPKTELEESASKALQETAAAKQAEQQVEQEVSLDQRLAELREKYGEDLVGEAIDMDARGTELYQQGDFDEAFELYQSYFEIWEVLVETNPADDMSQNNWSWSYVTVGRSYAKKGEQEKAKESWTKAVEIIEPVTAANPDNLYYLDTHAQALLNLGRVEEAKPIVTKLLELGHDEAVFMALCRKHGLINAP